MLALAHRVARTPLQKHTHQCSPVAHRYQFFALRQIRPSRQIAMSTAVQSSQDQPKLHAQTPEKISQAVTNVGKEADQPEQPGVESIMKVQPQYIHPSYQGSGKLAGKVALITGGDSGIGRAVAVHFAREGAAGMVIVYKGGAEEEDAQVAVKLTEREGAKAIAIAADVGDPEACKNVVDRTIQEFGRLDVLVNNAAEQHARPSITDITPEQLQRTFSTNLFSMFYLVQAALPHLKEGSSIINTTSVTAYKGKKDLLDYSTTKGGIVAFTRSLSQQLVEKGIRVNAVAPGPIWTPLIPATFGEESAEKFGQEVPMKRPGQPAEVAPAYVFLASGIESSYITGQVLHPNGGTILNV